MHTHLSRGRGWFATVATLLLIAAHVWLFTAVSRTHLSLTLAAGVVGLLALKLAWWKFRQLRAARPRGFRQSQC